jgi:hypothetical protein
MTVTTVGGVKNTRKPYPLQFEISCALNKGIRNYSNHKESSSKAQIASCLLMICAVAERGGLKPTLLSGRCGVGERWYVSSFQYVFSIFSNRQIPWGIQYPQIRQN